MSAGWGNLLAAAVLMAAAAAATARVVWLDLKGAGAVGGTTIRVCHWQLEGGLREAFDRVAAAYEARHPGVDIVQMPVPGRVYATWIKTRQVGDDMPDLVQLGSADDQMLATYFTPLSDWVEQPNPYQEGTPFAGRPWREGFLDGLAGASGMATLQEPYSVAFSMHTTRMYVNLDRYRQLTGGEEPPRTWRAFAAVCRQAAGRAAAEGRHLTPVAGSRFTANVLFDQLMRCQTQRLTLDLDDRLVLRSERLAEQLVSGRLTMDAPGVRAGCALMRDAAAQMQTGFMGYDRDEAIFHFVTGRALFIPTGSWDYGSIVVQAPFRVGVFPTPLPDRADPDYGAGTAGAIAESADRITGNLHLSARCRHPEVAIDFLRFLTSVEGNRLFVATSRWMPGIAGVEPHPDTAAFAPVQDGHPAGLALAPIMWGAGEIFRVQSQHLHLLFSGAPDALDAYLAAMRRDLPAAARRNLEKDVAGARNAARKLDPALLALGVLGGEAGLRRAAAIGHVQVAREWMVERSQAVLEAAP